MVLNYSSPKLGEVPDRAVGSVNLLFYYIFTLFNNFANLCKYLFGVIVENSILKSQNLYIVLLSQILGAIAIIVRATFRIVHCSV